MVEKRVKGIVLMSGGLDSTLAARVLMDLGVEVVGMHFTTGYSVGEQLRPYRDPDAEEPPDHVDTAVRQLGIPFEKIDLRQKFLDILLNPRHGYGANVNPCIDCKILMLREAGRKMLDLGADFVATGEVLGQRPMSQHRSALRQIEKNSGLEGRLLRPLSARLMPETIPEKEGLIDRERLLDISGRRRRRQMDMAEDSGITEYPSPAGGCILTDESFARRFRDMRKRCPEGTLTLEDLRLLMVGRHLSLAPDLKLIVGRNEGENNVLTAHRSDRVLFEAEDHPSPIVLTDGREPTPEEERLCAAVTARYSDGKREFRVKVRVERSGQEPYYLEVEPLRETDPQRARMI